MLHGEEPTGETACRTFYKTKPTGETACRTFYKTKPTGETACRTLYKTKPTGEAACRTFYKTKPTGETACRTFYKTKWSGQARATLRFAVTHRPKRQLRSERKLGRKAEALPHESLSNSGAAKYRQFRKAAPGAPRR